VFYCTDAELSASLFGSNFYLSVVAFVNDCNKALLLFFKVGRREKLQRNNTVHTTVIKDSDT